jgi:hypothetical protein
MQAGGFYFTGSVFSVPPSRGNRPNLPSPSNTGDDTKSDGNGKREKTYKSDKSDSKSDSKSEKGDSKKTGSGSSKDKSA